MTGELLSELRATTRQALAVSAGDIVDELGLSGLLVDADRGGLGLAEPEMALVATELGRDLSASAFLSTAVLAVTLLSRSDTEVGADLLAAVTRGSAGCAVAIAAVTPANSSVAAVPGPGAGWRLSGTAVVVSPPGVPGIVLLAAKTPDGVAVFAVDIADAVLTPADLLDPNRGLADVTVSDAPGRVVLHPECAHSGGQIAYRRALIAVAAEQVGVARACLDSAVEYAKTRTQFGAPIGSFQAIKHRCADVLLEVELADAVLADAVRHDSLPDAELAFIVATRAAVTGSEACIHVHGGIGFTWEHSAHWHLRRARVNATLLGPPSVHRDAIARSVGLTTTEEVPG
ncbi:Acyl-CoA dehydrogenase FadE18 [uncultured Mycobacterium sp.]|uniref:Acyl-CoA dehydrogenase FadE18 n=1 Tax=uncultured Mycobacterium sp. TaxID=171292 RepID=A0A1Y5PP06_9MYCO|nr:Acyl-CoA dehydrogenase FadE18 [uncultured Mycobacterium sp.]